MKNGFSLPEIEQAAISALIQWPVRCFPTLDQYGVTSEHFQTPQNRILFDCVKNFWTNGKPLELIVFTNELREIGVLFRVGVGYLTETWCSTCHSPDTFEYYIGLISEAHARRVMDAVFTDAKRSVHSPIVDIEDIKTETERKLSEITTTQPKERTLLESVQDKIERMERGDPSEDIISTGIAKLDDFSPLRRGDMPLITGLRKAGKSILALSIASNAARRGLPVLYFSLEDREPKIIDRLLAGMSRVPMDKHHVRNLQKPDMDKMQNAASELQRLPLHIKDNVIDLSKIVAISHELKARCQIALIVIDYAQLVRASEKSKDSNREQKVAEVSRTLRWLAMEIDTPVILLSQLNMDGYTRESRALEQDATACWHLEAKGDDHWINVPWQRNGKSGIGFQVTFLGHIARIENYHE